MRAERGREREEERKKEKEERQRGTGRFSECPQWCVAYPCARTALFSSKQCNHNSAFPATFATLPYRSAKSAVDQRILV